ncbi:MAG: hypothetical protein ABIO46_02500 [Chitinophagales bacterium]
MFAFFSCKPENKRLPDINSIPEEKAVLPEKDEQRKTFKGLFVVGKNMKTFRSCGSPDDNYFVIDSTGEMSNLYQAIFRSSPAFPYEYVYVEVKGMVQQASEAVAIRGFDSSIVVFDILTFEQKNYRNTCIPYDFWALGNEPNWSLQVSAKEGILALKDYSNNRVYLFEYFAPKVVNDEVFTYYSNNYANQTSISAIFKRMPCSDGMSDNEYEYSAAVVINGKRFSGCGIRGSGFN